jgi:uncharacterized protein YyaL (SSP411 family)
LDAAKKTLFEVREKRPRPHLDDKIITSWNGLMISAFARGYQVLQDAKYLQAATNAAEFIHKNLYKDGVLIRNYRHGPSNILGFADDYSFLISGLLGKWHHNSTFCSLISSLDLYEASGDMKWLQWAVQLQEKQNELFWDSTNGGYFAAREGDQNLLLRLKGNHNALDCCFIIFFSLYLLTLFSSQRTMMAQNLAITQFLPSIY